MAHGRTATRNLAVALALAAAACGDTAPSDRSPAGASAVPGIGLAPLDATVLSGMAAAIQDEYQAESVYQRVLEDFGDVWPFDRIVYAEERHSAAIEALYESRGLDPPSRLWTPADAPSFPSVAAACETAASEERTNVAIYDELLRSDLPRDVEQVFSNNRSASLLNHLPAFEACVAAASP